MTLPTSTSKHASSTGSSDSPPKMSTSSQSSHKKKEKELKQCEQMILLDKPDNSDNLSEQDISSRYSDSSQIELNRSLSHDSSKERKESRGSERSKKKSAWYNVLFSTYKSRSEDFKRNFKEVPPDERLIVDYSCALQKEILVQGRLYVSQNYLCFYANIFRWETTVIIKWKEVTSITKEKTALVIPNAILICTNNDKLFFTSFTSRDKAYMMLFRIWQNALMDQPMSMQEMWQWVHSSYGEELGLTSDDDDYNYVAPTINDDEKNCPPGVKILLDTSPSPDENADKSDGGRLSAASNSANKSPSLAGSVGPQDSFNLLHQTSNKLDTDLLPTDLSDTTESELDRVHELSKTSCTQLHEGKMIVNADLAIPIDQLFTLVFTNSKFFLEFHALRRTTDIKLSPWEQNPENGTKIRTLSMVVAVTHPLGPKSSSVIETQVMHSCSKPGQLYSIDSEIVNSGIPYADSFYISVHFCLTRLSEHETNMIAYAKINYKKSVWGLVKNVIEKNTWAGLQDFYESFVKNIRSECEELTKGRKTRRRRRVAGSNPVALLQDDALTLAIKSPMLRGIGSGREPERTSNKLIMLVLGVLLSLVILNMLLYYKLWSLESWVHGTQQHTTVTHIDLQILKNPPKTHEDWLTLLQQQEQLHRTQLDRWQKIVQAAVHMLRTAEDTLNELQNLIRLTQNDPEHDKHGEL